MSNFIEFDEKKKIIKPVNLDNFSIEDLEEYINILNNEVKRTKDEIKKKLKIKEEAQLFFK